MHFFDELKSLEDLNLQEILFVKDKDMLILGSSSERRKLILNFFSLAFIQVHSNFDERSIDMDPDPDLYTCNIAKEKALDIAKKHPNDTILTADTVVFFKNEYLLKPKDADDALQMLKKLSGKWHDVYTGVCVKTVDNLFLKSERSSVLFNKLSQREIQLYHKNFYLDDKAGGYAIQDGGSIVVKKMKGCFYNIMGLPINTTRELLLKAGIDLWDYLKPF